MNDMYEGPYRCSMDDVDLHDSESLQSSTENREFQNVSSYIADEVILISHDGPELCPGGKNISVNLRTYSGNCQLSKESAQRSALIYPQPTLKCSLKQVAPKQCLLGHSYVQVGARQWLVPGE
jgi:hypothetical protein